MNTFKPSLPYRNALRVACILVAFFLGVAPVVAASRLGECGPLACCGHCGLKASATAGMMPMAGADCYRGSDQTACNTTPDRTAEGADQLAAIGFSDQYKPIFSAAFVGTPPAEQWAVSYRQTPLGESGVFALAPLYLQHGILIC